MLGLIRRWRQMIAAMINQNDSNVIDVTLRFQVANSQSKVRQDSPPAFPKTNNEKRRTKRCDKKQCREWLMGHSMIAKLPAMTWTACQSVVLWHVLQSFSGCSLVVLWSLSCQSLVVHCNVLLFVCRYCYLIKELYCRLKKKIFISIA